MAEVLELNADQRRETVNTQQRYRALREIEARLRAHRGSMVWSRTKGHEYLMRVAYDRQGRRRQTSLGARSAETERIKAEFEAGRDAAVARLHEIRPVMARQAAVNRALGLGRVPLLSAKIIRALDDAGLLGTGIRVLGTNALYAYEAVAGVHIDPALTSTEDIDLLFDARMRLSFSAPEDLEEASLLKLLQKLDKSFERSRQRFRATNREGFLVDLIKPLRNPPWTKERDVLSADPGDLSAVEIVKLDWHESAPAFEAIAVDEKGEPLRMVTSDPRVFAVHKFWLARQGDREPVKAARDMLQARAVGALTAAYFQHLPFESSELRMLPLDLLREAASIFEAGPDMRGR